MLALVAAMLASACASGLSRDVLSHTPSVGATMVAGWEAGPLAGTTSFGYLPGERRWSRAFRHRQCDRNGLEIRIASDAEVDDDALCEAAASAARFVARLYPQIALRWRIDVVPSGWRYRMTKRWIGVGAPRVALAVPLFDDGARTVANLVDLIAHEGFHVAGFFSGDIATAGDERKAYYAGLCAQLAVRGEIPMNSLPGAVIEGVDDPMAKASSEAAYRVRREFAKFFEDDKLVAQSEAGVAVIERCETVLGLNWSS
ncbi:hypothetical protein BEN78_07395 [Xanthomonas citri pv. mangiferaeindicae]|nr:hypothetical protein BEN78_07395 [Xanthomonas citri pv. mangiferaeindicae]